jgi:alpha-1,3-rhamnosyl/mannosyltransferase
MSRATVGINLLWLVPGVVGGSEEYTTRLLAAMADDGADDLDLTLFVNSSFAAVYPTVLERFAHAVGPVSGRSKPARVASETTWLAWQSRRRRLHLMHHMGGIMPPWRPSATVLTIHDLQPLSMPGYFNPTKRAFSSFVIPRSVRAAGHIVTLTEFTKFDLVNRLDVDPARITVVPPGFDLPPAAGHDGASRRVRDAYGLGDRPFFLHPAITYPHKNHLMLLRAFARLVRTHPDALLVLTGGEAQMEADVRATIESLEITASVRRTGRIPAADIDELYRTAAALTFPSLHEGFGLPVLEAMSRGCPVIAADATALPEVVDGAGLLVPASDPDRWSDAMARILDDPALSASLIRAGHQRALNYDWTVAASVLADVYRQGSV